MAESKVDECRAWMASLTDLASQPLEIPDAPEGIDVKAAMSQTPDGETIEVDAAPGMPESQGRTELSAEERGYVAVPPIDKMSLAYDIAATAGSMKMPRIMEMSVRPVGGKDDDNDNMKAYTATMLYGITVFVEPVGGDSWSPESIGYKTVFVGNKKYWVEGDRLPKLIAALMQNNTDYVAML